MYGARARIGLLVPSSNTTIEMEFHKMAPEGVSVHATRLYQAETNDPAEKVKTVLQMHQRLEAATVELVSCEATVLAYGCTTGSFVKGVVADEEMCARFSRLAGIPFLTTSTAIIAALQRLNLTRVALATPYIREVNEREMDYLAACGVEVVSMKGLNIVGNLPKGKLYPADAASLAREVDCASAEAILISCTNWRTVEVIGQLEAELGKPVISSNQATFWAALRYARLDEAVNGYGQLLLSDPFTSSRV